MSIFEQTIFPPVIKPEKNNYDLINWGLDYWFVHNNVGITMMCRCPICEINYAYSHLKLGTNPEQIYNNIKENERMFYREFVFNCPEKKGHYELAEDIWTK